LQLTKVSCTSFDQEPWLGGSTIAPTGAPHLVGVISLAAVVGGPHPHHNFRYSRSAWRKGQRPGYRISELTSI